jgi:hypothetical protein
MATEVVYGVESIWLGTPGPNGQLATDFVKISNIEDGSVSYTTNADTKTNIIPEDKDVPLIVLYTPGDPDTFNFGLLEMNEANYQKLFNTEFNAATSLITVLATRKQTPLAIKLITRPQFGVKKIFIFQNTLAAVTLKNNFTKNALVSISVVASVLSFKSPAGADAIYTVQTVDAVTGLPEDSTPPVASAGTDITVSSGTTSSLVGTGTATSPKTIVSQLWEQISGPNTSVLATPTALTCAVSGLVSGTYVFRLTVTDSNGDTGSDNVNLTKS